MLLPMPTSAPPSIAAMVYVGIVSIGWVKSAGGLCGGDDVVEPLAESGG